MYVCVCVYIYVYIYIYILRLRWWGITPVFLTFGLGHHSGRAQGAASISYFFLSLGLPRRILIQHLAEMTMLSGSQVPPEPPRWFPQPQKPASPASAAAPQIPKLKFEG